MKDINIVRTRSSLNRLRQRMRMVGSSMISVEPHRLKFPFTLSQIFTAIEELDRQINELDYELEVTGGGGV